MTRQQRTQIHRKIRRVRISGRPPDFECPWCGPRGVPINRDLPVYLRLCDRCLPAPTVDPLPSAPVEPAAVGQLRAILADHIRDFRRPWPGAEWGKTLIGNALLSALTEYGCDRRAELDRAIRAAAGAAEG